MKLNRFSTIIFFVGLAYCACSNAYAGTNFLVLDGSHRFSPDDNSAYSSFHYDDSRWQSIAVPGSWQSQRIRSVKGIGWYRIHFQAPESLKNIRPAVLLGRIGDADEVFLNGAKIGGEGLIGEKFVEATKIVRLYKIPPQLLRYSDGNLLSVRVMNTYLNGGIFDKNVAIGDYNALMIEKLKRDRNTIVMEFCFFTFFAIFFMTCVFFFIKGLKDKEYLYFWLFMSLYGVLFFLGSVTFYDTGLKTPLIQKTINALADLIPASLILLLIHAYQEKLNIVVKIFLPVFPLIALVTIVSQGYSTRVYLYGIWKIFFILTAAFMVFHAVKAYFSKYHEAGPLLLGISGLIVGLILESVGGLDLLQITGFFLWDYSAGFFMICVMYALTARYKRITEELHSASVQIFNAHEDERKRLARDLHDGVGQSLLSVKLRLKMLEARVKEKIPEEEKAFSELMSDMANSLEELRAVAMDLRPSFLENTDLSDAINWYAEKVQEHSGIRIVMNTQGLIKMGNKIKDNLYRIFQEALSNILKHSGASAVEVNLMMEGKNIHLHIHDNGKGLAGSSGEGGSPGIGYYTIRERVQLLGGILRIRSSDETGTSISIEVPVE